MADRTDFHFRPKVTGAELGLAFELLELADRNLTADVSTYGIISNAEPTRICRCCVARQTRLPVARPIGSEVPCKSPRSRGAMNWSGRKGRASARCPLQGQMTQGHSINHDS